MAVPKRKKTSAKSAVKYSAFVKNERNRISNLTKITPCGKCGAPHLAHTVCPECGFYADRLVIARKTPAAATVIKA